MAWGVPKLGALVEAASGNLTLTEPAGIAQGDLMIACIGYRSNAPFTVPGDWNLVATQQSSGDVDATNGIASGVMMWCVRGASAPTLTFNRTAGDVAQGRIIAYSGGSDDPFDTGSANTLGVASATVTTGSLTTAQGDELIVAMVSCGDNLTTSAFDAATDPTTASGATDTTTAPTAGTWIERADNGTGTGADHGLAIADAIRATAGSTGTIQATVSASAQHVMIAAAFKIAGPSASASVSPSASQSPSSSPSPSVSPSASVSPSSSASLSLSPSSSASPSSSVSPSLSPSASPSPSSSVSLSLSPSSSASPSSSESPSVSPSASLSPSSSESASVSPSSSISPSSSASPSLSPSTSISPSASLSPSSSASPSPPPPPPNIKWLDPGGDAVQAVGYFNQLITGDVSFDTSQKVVGVGSWKFDSGDGTPGTAAVKAPGVLTPAEVGDYSRRVSFWWRYDSVPDDSATTTQPVSEGGTAYSGGGFTNPEDLILDEGLYATATPAKNAGQGNACGFANLGSSIPVSAVIDSVKIIYERKYDVNTSIGISRVKTRIDGVEGPDHDNTDMPLTDTVVEVDVTAERAWTPPDFANGVFEVIAEARRGDTDTSHTQSWDYVKVEVVYHLPAGIFRATDTAGSEAFTIAATPAGSGVVLGLIPKDEYGYYGITQLLPNTDHRISLAYVHHDLDDIDIRLFVDSVQELDIDAATTGDVDAGGLTDIQHGWLSSPGADHLCWFDQIYVDDGDDLSDPGNKRSTYKGPASVNQNEWTTTGGTGAVDERPLSETNYKRHSAVIGTVRQDYTLQTAAAGDVDISGESLVGWLAWVWATEDLGAASGYVFLVANGADKQLGDLDFLGEFGGIPSLVYNLATTDAYPSDAAGIGMVLKDVEDFTIATLYECGAIVCYEGPDTDDPLFPLQLLQEDTSSSVSDDMGGTPPTEYELKNVVPEVPNTVVTTTISSRTAEGEVPQQQAIIENRSGEETGIVVVSPGIEVSVNIDVAGADAPVELRRVDQSVV